MSEEQKLLLSTIRKNQYSTGEISHWNSGNTTPDHTKAKIQKTLLKYNEPKRKDRELLTASQKQNNQIKLQSLINVINFPIPFDCTIENPQVMKRMNAIIEHINTAKHVQLNILSAEKSNVSGYLLYKVQCNTCDLIFELTSQNFREYQTTNRTNEICPSCRPLTTPFSKGERELGDFIESLGISIERNVRSILPNSRELDIWIPQYNLAIEYSGGYWHSEQIHHNKLNIHDKHELANALNIQLITIFDDEWILKQEICKARIAHKLGHSERKIHARKCIIREIDSNTKREFLNNFHIQGSDVCKLSYGAWYEEELIAVMTFKPTNMVKGGDGTTMELSRFVTKSNISCSGIGNRLFKHSIKSNQFDQIITYSDRRWNTGNLYKSLGCYYSHKSPPSYWYIKPGKLTREHRSKYMKHRLVERGFDSNKTSHSIMDELGFIRIWDCGSDVWKWKSPKLESSPQQ